MNDLPVGRSVDETIRLVQAFQYTDSHGEVCPAGWRPGSDTVYKSIAYKTQTLLFYLSINMYFLFCFHVDRAKSKG